VAAARRAARSALSGVRVGQIDRQLCQVGLGMIDSGVAYAAEHVDAGGAPLLREQQLRVAGLGQADMDHIAVG
jgi:hypothetical protein